MGNNKIKFEMFNTFASALLASVAIAVGDNNGLGQANAVTT